MVYGSHLLLDGITVGGSGMKLLWPLSQGFAKAPWPIFPAVEHGHGLLHIGHGRILLFEAANGALLLGLTTVVHARWGRLRDRSDRASSIIRPGESDG